MDANFGDDASPAAPASAPTSRAAVRAVSQKSYGNVSAGELADICVSYGLEPQTPDEDPPMSSKRSYVKRRLRTLSREALLAWLAASTRTTQPPRWPSW